MGTQEALNKSWLTEAWLLALLWFPPFGIVALYHAFQAKSHLEAGDRLEGLKDRAKTRIWIRRGLLAGLVWLIFLAAFLFLKGGEIIPAMAAFY